MISKTFLLEKAIMKICGQHGINYEQIQREVVKDLRKDIVFPENPNKGDIHLDFMWDGIGWAIITTYN